jgi:hypothetical protein
MRPTGCRGCSPEKSHLKYNDFLGFVHPEDRERVEQAIQNSVAHETINIEFPIR